MRFKLYPMPKTTEDVLHYMENFAEEKSKENELLAAAYDEVNTVAELEEIEDYLEKKTLAYRKIMNGFTDEEQKRADAVGNKILNSSPFIKHHYLQGTAWTSAIDRIKSNPNEKENYKSHTERNYRRRMDAMPKVPDKVRVKHWYLMYYHSDSNKPYKEKPWYGVYSDLIKKLEQSGFTQDTKMQPLPTWVKEDKIIKIRDADYGKDSFRGQTKTPEDTSMVAESFKEYLKINPVRR
jgi:hypothetical protein